MYMISADLARTIVDSSWVKDEAEAALQLVRDQAASKNDRAVLTAAEPTWPWEDVFIGAALAHAVPRGPNLLAYVHAGYERYVDEWGATVAPSTLVWHQKSKVPARIRMVDTWQMSHHCELPSRYVVYNKNYTSCTGATWICGETALDRSRRTNCSSRYENLLGHAKRAADAFHQHGKVSRRGAATGSQDGSRPTAAARRRVAAAGRGAGPASPRPHHARA